LSGEIFRATIFHTPRNPFREPALEAFADGGLLVLKGRIAACGDFSQIRAANPGCAVHDFRGGFLLPGLIDTHTHFPQLRIVGNLGHSLLDWLEHCALPEESRMADAQVAAATASAFVHTLAANGTTTALVFGSHFSPATACLFQVAEATGLRIVSGLVLADRNLRPDLHKTPEAAYRESAELIRTFHGRGRSLYALTPRFALSTSDEMFEVCQTLLREHIGLRVQTHLNENRQEIAAVARAFPWAADYFAVYERFGLAGRRSVMAHDVHPTPSELQRLSASRTSIAHCPSSNTALGSGIFAMRAHLDARVHFGLGTDIGAGTTFSLLREALQAYYVQRLSPDGVTLNGSHLLYLATRAGAEALDLEAEAGDFTPGKSADFVYLRAGSGTPLAAALNRADDLPGILSVLFTLAEQADIREVRVMGRPILEAETPG
jgi:guanine deaminase